MLQANSMFYLAGSWSGFLHDARYWFCPAVVCFAILHRNAVFCESIDRRCPEVSTTEDEDDDNDSEFVSSKKIKLENAANSAGNFLQI